jgi:hypothetical protein
MMVLISRKPPWQGSQNLLGQASLGERMKENSIDLKVGKGAQKGLSDLENIILE